MKQCPHLKSIITKNIYNNAESVVAYCGDSLTPPVYGKEYIAVKTRTGSLLNDQTKKDISAKLRSYAMATIEPCLLYTSPTPRDPG